MSTDTKAGGCMGVGMKRKEDPRFIQGKGHYVDDLSFPGMLYLALVRSPYPHAEIESIDISEAMKVPGVKAIQDADLTSFSVAQCGGVGVALDKLLDNNYCITLVPVDKQGREMRDCPITNCAQTNSLLKIAIKKFLETKLKNAMAIPAAEIPKDLKPYIKLPDENDFIDAALGKRSLDFSGVVDTEGIQGMLASKAQGFVVKQLNEELAGTAFENAFNSLDDLKKQAILSKVSATIKDDDARLIANDLLSGQDVSKDAQRIAMGKATDYIADDKAKEVLKELATSGDPQTAAFNAVQNIAESEFEKASVEEKRKVMEKAANSKEGKWVKDKVIDRAAQTGCSNGYNTNPSAAINCLSEKEIDAIYKEAFTEKEAAKAVLASQVDDMHSETAKAAVKALAQSRDINTATRAALQAQFDQMPDSQKKDLLQEVMRSSGDPEKVLQSEMMKRMPIVDNELVSAMLKDGNVQGILEGKLKDALKSQFGLFISQKCQDAKN